MSKSGIPWYTYTYWRHYKHPISGSHSSKKISDALSSTFNPREKTCAWYVFVSVLVAIAIVALFLKIINEFSILLSFVLVYLIVGEFAMISAAFEERKKRKKEKQKKRGIINNDPYYDFLFEPPRNRK